MAGWRSLQLVFPDMDGQKLIPDDEYKIISNIRLDRRLIRAVRLYRSRTVPPDE
jgi:hypothetical protein